MAYLLAAAGLAVLHDEVMGLPSSRFGHDCEQIMLGAMLVLGMMGGLLLVEGSRLFEKGPEPRDRGRSPPYAARQVAEEGERQPPA